MSDDKMQLIQGALARIGELEPKINLLDAKRALMSAEVEASYALVYSLTGRTQPTFTFDQVHRPCRCVDCARGRIERMLVDLDAHYGVVMDEDDQALPKETVQ